MYQPSRHCSESLAGDMLAEHVYKLSEVANTDSPGKALNFYLTLQGSLNTNKHTLPYKERIGSCKLWQETNRP